MNNIYIIGAGGVGSWLAPAICLLKEPNAVTLVDGDKLEAKNLNRQLFTKADIGKNKADALAAKYGCKSIPSWYSHGLVEVDDSDWILCCVDNNPARASVLETCDMTGCAAIFGANEVYSSEAYFYHTMFRATANDPRVYYPEIETDRSDDPRAASIGCTGEAQRQNRQLVSANFMASGLMMHMFVVWNMEAPKMEQETIKYLPIRMRQNLTKSETFKQQ